MGILGHIQFSMDFWRCQEDRHVRQERIHENMDERRRSRKKWREAHPEKVKEYNHAQYLRRKALKEQEKEDGRSKTES